MTEQPGLVTDGGTAGADTAETQEPVFTPFLNEDGDEDTQVFEVTKPIMLVQLQDEIEAKVGQEVMVSYTLRDPEAAPSSTNPMSLQVSPESLDGRTVRGVINSHIPDPNYGLGPEAEENRSLVEKVNSGETLTSEEVSQVLRMLLQGQNPA